MLFKSQFSRGFCIFHRFIGLSTMIKGILFDKDGTLLEFHSTMHHIYTDVLACLKNRYQVPEELVQALKTTLGYLPDRLCADSLLQFSTNPQIAGAIMAVSYQHADRLQWDLPYTQNHLLDLIEERSLAETVPYVTLPGVRKTLGYLHTRGYRLGIATADTLSATTLGLEKTGLLPFFDFLGTGDLPKPKPDPYMADQFCSDCGISGNELLIVGDSENDMRFAENAGARFLGIVSPTGPPSPLTQYKTTVDINRMIDIFNL